MPKNEIDPSDPMELVGVTMPASSEAVDEMGLAFTEEFLRMGYSPEQVLMFFKNPFYRGPNQVYTLRGEQAVQAIIHEACRKWGPCVDRRPADGKTPAEQEVAR